MPDPITRPRLLPLLLLLLLAAAYAPAGQAYELQIIKSKQTLLVKDGGLIARRYHIAHGKGGRGPKMRQGDNRTPTGTYRIVDFNAASRFHFFMLLDYPNLKDAVFGLENRRINHSQFEHIVDALKDGKTPPQNTSLGGMIGIHGIGAINEEKLHIHNQFNWTNGCIALTNDEILDLRKFVDIGTKVVIQE
jgi:murein L,D-transpeptidase YafK